MREIQSYLIRIYRRDAESMAGVVEHVQRNRTVPFRSLAELCELLSGRKPFTRRREGAPGPHQEPKS